MPPLSAGRTQRAEEASSMTISLYEIGHFLTDFTERAGSGQSVSNWSHIQPKHERQRDERQKQICLLMTTEQSVTSFVVFVAFLYLLADRASYAKYKNLPLSKTID